MRRRALYFEIAAISFAAILLEIAYTRIFSFKVYYYFTYLILGIALLGLGAGGALVAVSGRLRAIPAERLIPALGFVAAAAVGAGYFAIAYILAPSALLYMISRLFPPVRIVIWGAPESPRAATFRVVCLGGRWINRITRRRSTTRRSIASWCL